MCLGMPKIQREIHVSLLQKHRWTPLRAIFISSRACIWYAAAVAIVGNKVYQGLCSALLFSQLLDLSVIVEAESAN